MKSYIIPQFLILNNDTNNAVVQNKNGINYLTNRSIISFFNKIDDLHKNLVTEQFLEDYFGLEKYKSTLKFMLDSQLLEEKVEYYSEYKNTVVFTNNKKIYNLMSKVMNEKNDTLTRYYFNTFQSDRFEAKIKEISDDSLIITIFSPLDFNEYTWLCDFLRENNKIYCTAFPYNKKFYFSNIYSYKWKNSCPKCFISELISSLRSTGKFYSMPTFQTVIDIIYNENIKLEIHDFNNLSMNLEIIKSILEISDSNRIDFFTATHREIDTNGNSFFDQCVHWELCNCME